MDEVLALQYRRRAKRLQLIVLPYSMNISAAALMRFSNANDKNLDATKNWRSIPIIGLEMTMKINGLKDFVGDAMMGEVFNSRWMSPEGLYMETKGIVNTESWDFADLIADRVPRELLTRIHEQVDNWA